MFFFFLLLVFFDKRLYNPAMKYFITTFGCQMNVHESEKLAGALENLGALPCQNLEEADVIVFNTCAIREGAEDRAIGNIGALKKLKKEHPEKIVAVCGCMTQIKEESEKLAKTFPFIDIIFGTKNLEKFEGFIKEVVKSKQEKKKKRINEIEENDYIIENLPIARTSGKNFWVNIIYGCNNFCTYCIVPYVRGRERSRDKEQILDEIKKVIKENESPNEKIRITLLGQNVNSYGKDKYEDYSFVNLLKDICKLDGNFELAFMTSHPKDINDEVIETIAKEEKIAKELHLPVQSGSNKILKAMNRNYTVEKYMEKVNFLRSLIPNIRLSTDLIVGFPGETEEDFLATCDLVKKVKYDGIFAFMYSPRPGTVAEKMENQVPQEIKNYRVNKIFEIQQNIKK